MPDTHTDFPCLHVLQMGSHGNAIALVSPKTPTSSATLSVIDWGIKDRDVFRSFLDENDIERVRFVLATHSHTDHTSGIPGLLEELVSRHMPPDNVFFPASGPMTLTKQDYIGWAKDYCVREKLNALEVSIRDISPLPPEKPFAIAVSPNWCVEILAPAASAKLTEEVRSERRSVNPGNPSSFVVLFRYIDHDGHEGRAVLPGDATPALLKFAREHADRYMDHRLDNDVIIAPHHGSKNNFPDFLYSHVKGLIVVSAGPGSKHHPSLDFLKPASRHCKQTNGESRLFCTSYAYQCRETYAKPPGADSRLSDGPCFGNIVIELRTDGSRVISSDPDGDYRRKFGFCSQ